MLGYRGAMETFSMLSGPLTEALKALSRRRGRDTLYDAARGLKVLLHRY